jgi:hypothetical protein
MRENPNHWVHAQEPSEWCGRSKHILLSQRGRKARKIPAMGRIFLLTFPFIERNREKRQKRFDMLKATPSAIAASSVHQSCDIRECSICERPTAMRISGFTGALS